MDEPEPLSLTSAEAAVTAEIARREAGATDQRMTRTYRRMLELVRSEDEIDAILAAHLARDFLAASPVVLGLGSVERGHFDAGTSVARLAATWPTASRDGDPPDQTIVELRRELDEYDAASTRAEMPARRMFSAGERAAAGYVPDPSIARWRLLSVRATDLAHRVKAPQKALPNPTDARRVVDELTATLLSGIGPFLTGLDEIDRFLTLDTPSDDDATRVVALLGTHRQLAYFFERADARWLAPLARIHGLLESTPPVVDVGRGYVFPSWPQGGFLGRVAQEHPAEVRAILRRVQPGDNASAIATVVRVARQLPPGHACVLADQIGRSMAAPNAVDYAAVDAAAWARELAAAGHAADGGKLLIAVARAAVSRPGDSDWHLEQTFDEGLETIASGTDLLAPALAKLLKSTLQADGALRRHTTLWLRQVDQKPRYGPQRAWHLANALYRVLVVEPIDAARVQTARLLDLRHPALARVALAAIAKRPELVETSAILADPAAWDDPSSTRHEFRRAMRALWDVSTPGQKDALLSYAEAAEEAVEIINRIAKRELANAPSPDVVRRGWRSRLLHEVRHVIPNAWLERLGTLDDIADEPLPEPEALWVGPVSSLSDEDLAAMEPTEVLRECADFESQEREGFDVPTVEGLAAAAGRSISSRAAEFRGLGGQIADLPGPVVGAIVSAIHRGIREAKVEDKSAAFHLVLEIAIECRARRAIGEWPQELKGDVAGTITVASQHDLLTEPDVRLAWELIEPLLGDPDPSVESERRDIAGGYDVGMLALNGIRAEATTATIEVLGEAIRLKIDPLVEEVRNLLRQRISADQSLSVRAALGLRLPWLLEHDPGAEATWLAILFGPDVDPEAGRACWHAYLLYSRYFRSTAILLAPEYDRALTDLKPRPEDDRGRPHDAEESLGIHVGIAHITRLPAEGAETWLARFYANAADWLRARTTRWLAEQSAVSESTTDIRDRARAFLRERITILTSAENPKELKAVGWIGRTEDRPEAVLEEIVLPALERSGGATDDEPGLTDLVSRCANTRPLLSARALELLVRGDEWHSLPHIAGAELQRALEALRVADRETRVVVRRIVDLLGEQGFLEYRDLLPPTDEQR